MPKDRAEQMGYKPDTKLVIITCDGLGSSHAANLGIYQALRGGRASSASLIVPAPWAREAASRHRGEDVGVQLTLNAEHDLYRWGPITYAPSLRDGDGGFPRTIEDAWEHADLDEVRRECRAQTERAIYWGFDVTHVSSHLDVLVTRPEFFDVYLELALDFKLPMRLPSAHHERTMGYPFRKLALEQGALFPDYVVPTVVGSARRTLERTLSNLGPGVTEIWLHPAADTPELRALANDWAGRTEDLNALRDSGWLDALLQRTGATLIDYRALRTLGRNL